MNQNGTATAPGRHPPIAVAQAGYLAKLRDSTARAGIRFLRMTSFGVTLVDVVSEATVWDDPTEAWKYAEIAGEEFQMAFIALPRRPRRSGEPQEAPAWRMPSSAASPGRRGGPKSEPDLETMSVAELDAELQQLRKRRDPLAEAVANLDRQIGRAKSRVFTDGKYSDPGWFQRTCDTLALKQGDLRRINRRILAIEQHRGQLARAETRARTQEQDARRERRFIQAARDLLDKDTYLAIWQLVGEQADAEDTPPAHHNGELTPCSNPHHAG